jgi:hypothetical protein
VTKEPLGGSATLSGVRRGGPGADVTILFWGARRTSAGSLHQLEQPVVVTHDDARELALRDGKLNLLPFRYSYNHAVRALAQKHAPRNIIEAQRIEASQWSQAQQETIGDI